MTLVWFAVGFALAAGLGVYLPWMVWILPAAAAALAAWFLLRRKGRGRIARPVLLGVAISLAWLTAYGAIFHAPAEAMEYRTVRLEGVVTDWPEATQYGARIPVRAREEDGRKVKALFYGDADLLDLRPGDKLSGVAYCTPADRVRGEESLYYTSRGILLQAKGYGQVTVTRADGFPVRYAMTYLAKSTRGVIDRLYPETQAGFLCALLTGDKSGLNEIDQHNVNRVGLGHVAVISGLHVTFLVGFLSLFLKPGRPGSFVIMVTALALFCLMTGSGPGTVRAVILCALGLLGPMLGREYHSLTGLSAALLLLLAVNPYAIANGGLQFSFLSTLGILCFGQRWNGKWMERIPKQHRRWWRPLVAVAAISLGAMLFTVPLSAFYFGRFSLIAPVANLAANWAVSLAFLGGMLSVLLGAVVLPLGQLLAPIEGLPIRFFLWLAARLSKIPLAAITLDSDYYRAWMVLVYVLLFLWLFAPGKGKRPVLPICAGVATLCLSALLTAGTVQRQALVLSALDIGQGQSVAVCSGSSAVLIDCGGTLSPGDTAAAYFQSLGKHSLDLLVLTHFHEDHAGGVPELLGRLDVKAIAVPDVDEDSAIRREIEAIAFEQDIPIYTITEESAVSLDRAEITLFPPVRDSGESNEQCLSVLCTAGDWDALLTGDMPTEDEDRLLAQYGLPDLELFVAGHHGSRYATGEHLLRQLTPETVLISVGYNTYGHPAQDTLDRLDEAGAEVYRTDQLGTITVYSNPKEAESWQKRPKRPPPPTAS